MSDENLNKPSACRDIIEKAGGLDQALDTAPILDREGAEEAVRLLLKAYYRTDKDCQDVDWGDIQEAVTKAAASMGLDEGVLAEMQIEAAEAANMEESDDGPTPQ